METSDSAEEPFLAGGVLVVAAHAHAAGRPHIESPQPRTFALGDFFAIWRKPLTSSQGACFSGD
jgi:hypothetical protein